MVITGEDCKVAQSAGELAILSGCWWISVRLFPGGTICWWKAHLVSRALIFVLSGRFEMWEYSYLVNTVYLMHRSSRRVVVNSRSLLNVDSLHAWN
jgi:hypothetical protein